MIPLVAKKYDTFCDTLWNLRWHKKRIFGKNMTHSLKKKLAALIICGCVPTYFFVYCTLYILSKFQKFIDDVPSSFKSDYIGGWPRYQSFICLLKGKTEFKGFFGENRTFIKISNILGYVFELTFSWNEKKWTVKRLNLKLK